MPEPPAKHLARIKVQHPLWSIRFVEEGFGFEAVRGEVRLWAFTLDQLERLLQSAT
jgi:hypothetical protein